ncbi:MafI family immunity protein [Pseudomonas citronellolis]|uniref:MafI family immunity protein n=1 Tax=Pseudomonas citronellolis TaxID=53408 RepID=UPI002112FF6A|nr:MafI family immunity protein [Pseudomonas citronellolis]UUC49765.1 MafI family immunity protein [Pseudomonas citronellolis]
MYKPEEIIKAALNEVAKYFDDDTEKNIEELLEFGEPGVALEVLCSQLVEFDISVPVTVKERLDLAARIMGMKVDELQDLKVL